MVVIFYDLDDENFKCPQKWLKNMFHFEFYWKKLNKTSNICLNYSIFYHK
jgi:hypothetical protein